MESTSRNLVSDSVLQVKGVQLDEISSLGESYDESMVGFESAGNLPAAHSLHIISSLEGVYHPTGEPAFMRTLIADASHNAATQALLLRTTAG
jgi:hypothetical protein